MQISLPVTRHSEKNTDSIFHVREGGEERERKREDASKDTPIPYSIIPISSAAWSVRYHRMMRY